MVDAQTYIVIIFSLMCAVSVTSIFRDARDDGSELIIMSKPISRWKIVSDKFILFILYILVSIFVSAIIMLFAFLNSHTNYNEIVDAIFSLIIASLIIAVFFGSIAILISMLTGKIGIICITIGIAIAINITHMVLPIIAKTPFKYVEENLNVSISSTRAINDKTNEEKNIIYSSNVHSADQIEECIDDAEKNNFSKWIPYIDIGNQFQKFFQTINNSKQANNSFHSWGDESGINYKVDTQKTLFDKIKDDEFNLVSFPRLETYTAKDTISHNVIGITEKGDFSLKQIIGANADSVIGIFDNPMNAFGQKFFDFNYLSTYDDEDYVNYIFDKYLWFGSDQIVGGRYNYTIADPYWKTQTDTNKNYYRSFSGYAPESYASRVVSQSSKDNFYNANDLYSAISRLLINDPQTIPDNPNYNSSYTNFEYGLEDTEDGENVPCFDDNFKINDSTNRHYHTKFNSGETFSVPEKLFKALGPYPSNINDEYKINIAASKLDYILTKRYSDIFWHPTKYYGDTTFDATCNIDGTEISPITINVGDYYHDFSDISLINEWKKDGWQHPEGFTNLLSRLRYLVYSLNVFNSTHKGILPHKAPTTKTPSGNEYLYNDYNSSIYTSDIFYTPIYSIENIKNAFTYTTSEYLDNTTTIIFWIIISILLFGTTVIIYAKTDFK